MNGMHEIEKRGRCETKVHKNGHLHCAETFLKEGPAMRFIPLTMPHQISIALPGQLFERVTNPAACPLLCFASETPMMLREDKNKTLTKFSTKHVTIESY